MLGNWISLYEIYYLVRKLQREPETVLKLIPRLPLGKSKKTRAAWAHTESPPTNWWDVPAIRKRWNYLISGDSSVDYCDYICQRYWTGRESLRALSLGCGTGTRELRWAETSKFSHIDAYDLSESRIRYAVGVAAQRGLGSIVSFHVDDVYKMQVQESFYDVILGESSLHHFSPLETILQRVSRFLKPDGYFIVNEFVGPTRFRWTSRQLEITNSLLAILPSRYKTLWNSTSTKLDLIRPSQLSMILRDPSEAIESSRILPLLNRIFDVVEIKGYGGAILHLLLGGIAHHFLAPDVEGQRVLDVCFEIEDLLLASGDIQDDFIVAVCRKRS